VFTEQPTILLRARIEGRRYAGKRFVGEFNKCGARKTRQIMRIVRVIIK